MQHRVVDPQKETKMSRTELLKTLLEFFQNEGRILKRTEYVRLGAAAPIHWRKLRKDFSGRGYHTVLKILEVKYPAEMRQLKAGDLKPSIKAEPKSEPKSEPKPEQVQAWEDELSPLEKLRQN